MEDKGNRNKSRAGRLADSKFENALHHEAVQWPKADVVLDADVPAVLDLFLNTLKSPGDSDVS